MEKLPDNFIKLGGKVDKSYRGLEKLDLSGNNFPSLAAITEVVNEENFPELYAFNYVECMWLILQHNTPEDFVIATGEMHTVREFATLAFKETGIELRWEGEGVNEKGIDSQTGKVLVEVDPKYFRPSEVEQLLGDPTKAKTLLSWNPQQTSFEELVHIMAEHDMKFVRKLHLRSKED